VPIDDPSLDVIESFSDWDYYSDDYYDDDPTILRRWRQTRQSQETENQPARIDGPPSKKRKVLPADEIPELSLGASVLDLDIASFRGVIWKRPDNSNKRTEPYEPGHGETVALLKNWREASKVSQHTHDSMHPNECQKLLKSNRKIGHRTTDIQTTIDNRMKYQDPPDHQSGRFPSDISNSPAEENYDDLLGSTLQVEFSPPPSSLSGWGRPTITKRAHTRSSDNEPELGRVMAGHENPSDEVSILYPEPEMEIVTHGEPSPAAERDNDDFSDRFQRFLYVEIPPGPIPRSSRPKKRKLSGSIEEPEPDPTAEARSTHKRRKVELGKTEIDNKETQATINPKRRSKRTKIQQKHI
jgi:hypothetical protein